VVVSKQTASQPEEELVKIQARGLLTIPKKFRQELALEEASLARLRKEKGRLIIEPVRTLPYPARSYTKKDLQSFLKLDKEESKKLRGKGLL